jgi:Holliday junction resolvasome RuvABC DNA-binding subunit
MIPIGVIEPIVAVKPPISKPKNTISAPFLADCVSALVNLGFKKKEATVLSIDIINSKNPSSVEEFIRLVFAK